MTAIMNKRGLVALALLCASLGCGGAAGGLHAGVGGSGGTIDAASGGAAAGGSAGTMATSGPGTGGQASGGAMGTGGAASGGIGSGGIGTGGSAGAAATGGRTGTGGVTGTGGIGMGGRTGTGGIGTGGNASGGTVGTGGAASGGAGGGGGASICDGFVMPNPVASGLPNPAAYDTSVAGIVADEVSGLLWERNVNPAPCSGKATCLPGEAAAYCAANRIGGYSDWRLPTVIELVSIVDFTVAKPGPTIDAVAFPDTPAEYFWTSTGLAGDSVTLWQVRFGSGTTYYDVFGGQEPYRVRCVRAASPSDGGTGCYSPPRLTVQGTGATATVTDAATKLVWHQAPSQTTMSWSAAKAYCGAPYRLPSVKELQTIVDYTKSVQYSTIDQTAFPSTPADYFWTSSSCTSDPSTAWTVEFGHGTAGCPEAGGSYYARCVR